MTKALNNFPDPRGGPEEELLRIDLAREAESLYGELKAAVVEAGEPGLLLLLRWKLADRSLKDYAKALRIKYCTVRRRWKKLRLLLRGKLNGF